MFSCKKIVSSFLSLSVVFCTSAQKRVERLTNDVVTGFEQMAKIERLPLLYPNGTKKNRMISYDASGGNGFGLLINTFKKYIDTNGDIVIFDAYGPGCLYREQMNIWTDNGIGKMSSTIRIKYYFDGETKPRIDVPVLDLFKGECEPVRKPFGFREIKQFGDVYYPFAFSKRLKIVLSDTVIKRLLSENNDRSCNWYQFDYLTFPQDCKVRSWKAGQDPYEEVTRQQWMNLGKDPKPGEGNVTDERMIPIPAGATATIFDENEKASISSIALKIAPFDSATFYNTYIRISFDDLSQPAVDMPISYFFGAGGWKDRFSKKTLKTLLYGFNGPEGSGYCYYPMPFFKHARIEIINNSTVNIDSFTYKICVKPASVVDYPEGQTAYFMAKVTKDHNPGGQTRKGFLKPYQNAFIEEGHGHVEAINMFSANYNEDGDEFTYIDNSNTPQIHGSGTEDEFNQGWAGGLFQQPLWGSLKSGVEGSYRIHMNEPYIFYDDINIRFEDNAGKYPGVAPRRRYGTPDSTIESEFMIWYYKAPGGSVLQLRDSVDVGNPASEEAHDFTIRGQTFSGVTETCFDSYETADNYMQMKDDGRAYNKYISFTANIGSDNKGVRIRNRICRTDNGIQVANVYVNGKKLPQPWYILTYSDQKNRRNRSFDGWFESEYEIPAKYTAGKDKIDIRMEYVRAVKNELNSYFLKVYSYVEDGQKPTAYVNPLIGAGGHGHVFVGASVPFGAVQAGPSNIFKGWDWCSGYHYSDSIIIGFPQTHLSGTGGSDLGDVLIMPYTGKIRTDKGLQNDHSIGYSSLFSHATEKVRPGYYSVVLDDYKIKVELTATERVAFHQYRFPGDGRDAHIIIDLKEGIGDKPADTYIKLLNDTTIVGYRFSKGWANNQQLYFAVILSQPVSQFNVYTNDTLLNGVSGRALNIKGVMSFKGDPGLVQLKVGISPVSEENALENIAAEIPGWNFNDIVRQADDKWNRELSKIDIETDNITDKRIFYTALYHTMIDPALFNDHNNDYRGTDKKVYRNAGFKNYTIFSLWDTYRALHPLYTIIQPEKVNDIINSMLAIYQQQGKLPVWHLMGCESNLMPGMSGVQVVAEAYRKGFRGFSTQLAYEAVRNSMLNNDPYRGLGYLKTLNYIPYEATRGSVAQTMEYNIGDGSIALMAKQLNKNDDYKLFTARSKYYKNYFDPATKFFRGKDSLGKWDPRLDPWKSSHPWIDNYCEGNVWQYTWLAPQDVEGVISLLGGEKEFAKRLDYFFDTPLPHDPKAPPDIAGLVGMYAHGNEPGHHTIYLYAYVGQQWKTAEKARYILHELYRDSTDGISGNEDCGQMSAWYIFSALGFYPVFPANCAYVMGSPLFNKAVIHLPEGRSFTVKAIHNSPSNIYIQSVRLNGKPYSKSYIMHQDIVKGGNLEFTMGSKPNTKFGTAESDRPKSMY